MAARAHSIAINELREQVELLRRQLINALDRIEKLEQDARASSETRRGAEAGAATTAKRPATRKRKAA